jgi:hypothetical protein
MERLCPGTTGVRRPTIELISCPVCGREVEIFSDEHRTKCKCGAIVFREKSPTCFEWCKYAEKCKEELKKRS